MSRISGPVLDQKQKVLGHAHHHRVEHRSAYATDMPLQVRKLKTRESDGAALCAVEDEDKPSRYAATSARMSNAPAAVACGMTCTADHQCRHFNYVATDSQYPCHLYYYSPKHFDQQSNCLHYHEPSESLEGQLCLASLWGC